MVQGRMKKINYKSKKNIRLPKSEWKIIKNTHEAIIDKKTFIKAKEMIETRKQTRIKAHDFLLKGFVYCHECGKKLGCSSRETKKGKIYYFRCNTYTSYSKQNYCSLHSIRMDFVETIVTDKVKSIINSFNEKCKMINITKQKLEENFKKISYKQNLENCEKKLSKLISEIDNIYSDKLNGIILQDDFLRLYQKKTQEKIQLQNIIDSIKTDINYKMINEDSLINKLIDMFNSNLTINREILFELIDRIEIDKDKKVYIFFKFKNIDNK